jgi:DNA-binding MarR family transcriptional regulator
MPPELVRVSTALQLVIGRIARRLRQAHAVGELTLSEISVLSRLDRDGASSPGGLAEKERVRPQAMGTTLAALEQRGLVQRRPDVADGRRVLMTVTTAGRNVLQDRRSENVQRLTRALSDEFTAAEQSQLSAVLPLLDRLAQRL